MSFNDFASWEKTLPQPKRVKTAKPAYAFLTIMTVIMSCSALFLTDLPVASLSHKTIHQTVTLTQNNVTSAIHTDREILVSKLANKPSQPMD